MLHSEAKPAHDFLCRLDGLLRIWGPVVLLIFAVCYYGQYYRSGLNLGGEGGTVAVNAMRLNEGLLPIKDTTLNYNVMWFYPVAWLFKVTGPNYVSLRIYFFMLCLLAGTLGFLIIRRVSGQGWYALGVGLLILLIPGMMFRNYMGFLTLLNAWALLHAFVFEPVKRGWRWAWFAVAGLALGLTFLLRIEVGLFFTVIYVGLVVIYPLGVAEGFLRRLPVALCGGLLCALTAIAIHVPFYVDANARGFGSEFVRQYSDKWDYVTGEARCLFRPSPQGTSKAATQSRPTALREGERGPIESLKIANRGPAAAEMVKASPPEDEKRGRPRQELRDIFKQHSLYDALFVLILHLPILIGSIIVLVACGVLARAVHTANAALKEPALVCLVTLGSALTLFSQYFFFRPDTPHLSEFMIPFLIAMACASYYAAGIAGRSRSWLLRVGGIGFVVLCGVSELLFFCHSFPKDSAGTIAAARKRSHEAIADNGVHVFLKNREQEHVQTIHDLVVRFSTKDEYVVTFPYSPTINFMTDRRSYLKDLYVDNASAVGKFTESKIAEIEHFKPAVIVIDERDINDTEYSRFKNWAAPVYGYILQHYVRVGEHLDLDGNEIYVRPDKLPPQT